MKSVSPQNVVWSIFFVVCLGALVWLNILHDGGEKNPRALLRPEDRLVGHWQLYSRSDLPSYELFFGVVGEDGRGSHTMVDEIQDQILLRGYYEIASKTSNDLAIDIRVNLGAQIDRVVTVIINRNGMHGEYIYERAGEKYRQKMKFIDANTEYTPRGASGG